MSDRPRGLFYEDLEVGASYTTKSRTVTEADIVNFAGFCVRTSLRNAAARLEPITAWAVPGSIRKAHRDSIHP